MEQTNEQGKNKGGRPTKAIRKNQLITLKCTSLDKITIQAKARKARLSVSEFMLEISRTGTIVMIDKVLPTEVLTLIGTLNHMAANLNQIARKRNSVVDELNAAERANLAILSRELKNIVPMIKSYLQ
jgi:hypothetical protein